MYDVPRLEKNTKLLKRASFTQIAMLLFGVFGFLVGFFARVSLPGIGSWLMTAATISFFASVVPYACALVLAYKVQDQLKKEGLYPHSALHIIVAGLLLNPYFIGFWPPLSTYLAAKGFLEPSDKGFSLGLK